MDHESTVSACIYCAVQKMIYRILLLRVPIDNRSPHLHGNHPRTERSDHFWFATYVKLASIYTAGARKSISRKIYERARTSIS